MQKYIAAFMCSALMPLSGGDAWADSVYKCRNQQGALIYQESPCKQDVQPVSSWTAAAEAKQQDGEAGKNFNGTLIIRQHPSGHYFMDGAINGKPLTFVIDTGASFVSLPRPLALSAQIYCKDKILMQTANGAASACTAVIPRLKFGPFLIRDAQATISPNLGQPLLGMSVLQQFRIEQDNGEMRLSVRQGNAE